METRRDRRDARCTVCERGRNRPRLASPLQVAAAFNPPQLSAINIYRRRHACVYLYVSSCWFYRKTFFSTSTHMKRFVKKKKEKRLACSNPEEGQSIAKPLAQALAGPVRARTHSHVTVSALPYQRILYTPIMRAWCIFRISIRAARASWSFLHSHFNIIFAPDTLLRMWCEWASFVENVTHSNHLTVPDRTGPDEHKSDMFFSEEFHHGNRFAAGVQNCNQNRIYHRLVCGGERLPCVSWQRSMWGRSIYHRVLFEWRTKYLIKCSLLTAMLSWSCLQVTPSKSSLFV